MASSESRVPGLTQQLVSSLNRLLVNWIVCRNAVDLVKECASIFTETVVFDKSLFDGSSSALCSAYAQGLVNDFGFDSLQSDETGATSADPTGGYTCGEVTAALEGNA